LHHFYIASVPDTDQLAAARMLCKSNSPHCKHACCSACTLQLKPALEDGLLSPADIDAAVNRTLAVRFITGQFDAPQLNPWGDVPLSTVNGRMSRLLARNVVQKGEQHTHVDAIWTYYALAVTVAACRCLTHDMWCRRVSSTDNRMWTRAVRGML
jgi:hypothetical protein